MFRDGYRKTYNKAIEHKIPLVSARWVENCQYAKKILDPAEYPPIDIEKYAKPREYNYNISVNKFIVLIFNTCILILNCLLNHAKY